MFGRHNASPRSQELVFLDTDDDLGTIRSKLEASTAEEIYLVLPNRSPVLRTPLEFRILARIANEVSSETVIVSGDGSRRRLAQQEGFRTRQSLRSLRHLMQEPGARAPAVTLPDWVPSVGVLFTTLLPLVLVVAAVAAVLPQLRVTLVPQTTSVDRDLDITVDPAVQVADVARGILPGELLNQQFQVPGSIPIPGNRTVGQEKARGEVAITSRRPDESSVPRGSRVAVPGGPVFITDQDLRVVPNVAARVGVTAIEAGAAGNVPAGAITAFDNPNFENLQVTNQRALTGGTDRTAKIVTAEDQASLREQLLQRATDQGFFELRARATQERSLPEVGLRIKVDNEAFDQAVGTEADQLSGRLTVTASAVAFQNVRFNELVQNMVVRSVGGNARLEGKATISPPGVLGMEAQRVKMRTHATGVVVPVLDEGELETSLRGKSLAEARAAIARLSGLAEPARVEMSPSWAPRALRVQVSVLGPK